MQTKSHAAALGEEKGAFPKASLRQRDDVLRSRRQTEKGCESFWDAEQLDGDLAICRGTRIASQSLVKVEPIMRALRTGKRRRRGVWAHGESLLHLHLEVLAAQRQARTSMAPTTPVTPSERFRPDDEWMRASRSPGAAWRWRCPAIDTAPAEGRGGNCGCWLHRLCAGSHRLLGVARAPPATGRRGNGACHRAGGESLDPSSGFVSRANPPGGSIARGRSRVRWGRRDGRSKLGGAHRIRMQLMAQLQAQVPHPLAHDLPYPLSRKGYDYTNESLVLF